MYTNLLCFHCFDLITAFKYHWFQRYSVFCLLDCHFILGDNFLEILFFISAFKKQFEKKNKPNTASKGGKWIQRNTHVEEI